MSNKKGYVNAADAVWANRFAKRYADDICFRAMAAWMRGRKHTNILSLPAAEWVWERSLSTVFNDGEKRFFGIDSDARVYEALRQTSYDKLFAHPNHELIPFGHQTFMELANSFNPDIDPGFDMIYLDWFGSWSLSKQRQISRMFEKDMLAKGSLFRFTIALNRDRPASWEELTNCDCGGFAIADIRGGGGAEIPEWRMYGIPALVSAIGADFGRRVKALAVQVYYNHTPRQSTPMGSFLFKVD